MKASRYFSQEAPLFYKLFAYGTLKVGEANHSYISRGHARGLVEFDGYAKTKDKYPLVVATKHHIPFLLDLRGYGANVYGEVYKVHKAFLGQLDMLEGVPRLFTRKNIEVVMHDDTIEHCITYIRTQFPQKYLNKAFKTLYRSDPSMPYTGRKETSPRGVMDDL